MTGKITSHTKLTHGHPLPDHLNPAKQPGGALKHDLEAGSSAAAQPKPNPAPAPAPAHTPGQDVPVSLQNRSREHFHGEGHSGNLDAPRFDLEFPPSPPDSPLPSWMEGRSPRGNGTPISRESGSPTYSDVSLENHAGLTLEDQFARAGSPSPVGSPQASRQDSPGGTPPRQDAGNQPDRSSASSSSSGLDELFGLMGGGKKKTWEDLRAGLNRDQEYDNHLDKHSFIKAHLDPDKPSPEHEKRNWTRLPDSKHPMFPDFVITENPQYYSFRRPEQRSAPLEGRPQPAPETASGAAPQAAPQAAPGNAGARLGRSQSLPADFRLPEDQVHPLALAIRENPGALVTGNHESPRREEAIRTEANSGRPHGSDPHAGADPVDPRLEALMQENAQLQQQVKDITRKAILGGVAAVGVGLAAGMLIEGGASEKPAPPADNA